MSSDYIVSVNRGTRHGAKPWRDLAMLAMHRAGKGPASIAVRLGVSCTLVTTTLREYGLHLPDWPYERNDPRNAINVKTLSRKR